MHCHAWAPIALASFALLSFARPSAAITGFTPSVGYDADDLNITADTFAVAPDGRFAVGKGSTVTIYNHADPGGRAVLATLSSPGFKTLGGLAFLGGDGLLVTDNTYLAGAVYSAAISPGTVSVLAAPGTANNAAQIRVRPTDGAAFVVQSNNPGAGVVSRLSNGTLTPFAPGLGHGYLGGLAFDATGDVYVGDTNDPAFTGAAGKILQLNGAGALANSALLAGGGGHGVYDIAFGNGDFYATTGNTITKLSGGTAASIGAFTDAYPFPTDIALDGGTVLVNGNFTGVGGVFRVRPTASVPEPSSLALLLLGAVPFLRRRT